MTDKEKKKQISNLEVLHARIAADYSFKKIESWDDVRKYIPVPSNRSGGFTYPELKEFFGQQVTELKKSLYETPLSPENRSILVTSITTPISSSDTTGNSSSSVAAPRTETSSILQKDDSQRVPSIEPVKPSVTVKLEDSNNYGFVKSPNESKDFFAYWFQKKAIVEVEQKYDEGIRAVLILAATGLGKTFMAGGVVRRRWDKGYQEDKTFSHIPYLYVTRSSIVEQTKRALKKYFNLGVNETEVINIEKLRSRSGQLWVKEYTKIVHGNEETVWEWKKHINPVMIIWDECQSLKNAGSTQHKIAAAFNDLDVPVGKETLQLFVSATPYSRVSDAKCFAVATRADISSLGFPPGTVLNNQTWPSFAKIMSGDGFSPTDYNEAAVERLTKFLDKYIVRVRGVRPQFEAKNSVLVIDFETKEEKEYYLAAWDRYLEEKAKIEAQAEAGIIDNAGIMLLVQFLKFRMAAEYCRRYWLAREMYNTVFRDKKAAVCACNFKSTIISIVQILVNDYNVPRDMISLVWGGGQTALTKKQKEKAKVKSLESKLLAAGVSVEEMLKDMDLDEVEDRIVEELDPNLKLGPQSLSDRQIEIDKFQSGKSLFCLYTFRAGGVGLSLHHTDELTKEKVRHRESGYAVEEDIPKIPTRPRKTFVAPTYSEIELVQGLGRAPRLTSLSETEQVLVFYRGTIEVLVTEIVSKKLRCLSKVNPNNKESWQDVIVHHKQVDELTQKHLDATPEGAEDTGGLFNEADSDNEEEDEE